MRRRHLLTAPLASLLVSAAASAAGCGTSARRDVVAHPHVCPPGAVRALGSPARTYAAVVRRVARAYRRPGAGAIARFRHDTPYGVPTVFAVRATVLRRDCRPAWYRVELPVKPNGRLGYVRAAAIRLSPVRTRIAVDLSRKLLTFYRDGRVRWRLRVGIGSSATPTPVGSFYVNQLFREDPAGPYGPAVLGISAYSNVLTWWPDGGPIAIHGTNRPWTIGRAASNGCIHVPNPAVVRLLRITPAGTPVVISA
jgi:lipoprotein-anchoring transpeptidase ErfK/SrfK